jgi:hypothetical protein
MLLYKYPVWKKPFPVLNLVIYLGKMAGFIISFGISDAVF